MNKLVSTLLVLAWTPLAAADVVVLSNRTAGELNVRMVSAAGLQPVVRLAAGEVVPLATVGPCEVDVHSPGGRRRYQLQANEAYYFGKLPDGRVEMHQIGLGGDEETARGRRLPGVAQDVATITVKILVDEEEPGVERLWQDRLRKRVEAASVIFEKHCRLKLQVVAFGTWNSDNATNDFQQSLAEFEREVTPAPAQLAIGFSSQYHLPQGRTHMGGTRGPLHSHILLREWSRHVSERERLELLVHELGHYLGAAHSPEPNSVMRPVLGDRQARAAGFAIGFDPVNTLAMYLVVEEMRSRNVRAFTDLTPPTQRRLHQIYTELARANPRDDSARRFVQLVQMRDAAPPPLERAVMTVLKQIDATVGEQLIVPPNEAGGRDELTEHIVKRAAATAVRQREEGPAALILALGIAIDDSQALRGFPLTATFVRSIETEEALQMRQKKMGNPTMRGRADLAKHFFISAYLAMALGRTTAETTGEAKELLDATRGSGFSFADMAANRAGIAFALAVQDGRLGLQDLASHFRVEDYMPDVADLEEGLKLADFTAKYGGTTDERYLTRLREIDERITALPGYRSLAKEDSPDSIRVSR